MSCEIYFGSGSPYSWSVLLTAAVKGVACDLHRVAVGEQQHKSEELLALNPRGKVPVLRDGDTVIYESIAIMAYLDRQHPDPPLFGRTPAESGVIWQNLSELQNYVSPPALRVVLPIFAGQTQARAGRIARALPRLRDELAGLERQLANSEYLAGPCLSAADLMFFPMLQGLLRAAGKPEASKLDLRVLPLGEHYPRIAAWIPRIEALPGYDQTYPPHWRNQ